MTTGTGSGDGIGRPQTSGPNVFQLISTVSAELAAEGIGKDRRNPTQGYNFRGVDDVYNALAPILSRHGLVILPRFIKREMIEKPSQKGGTLFFVTVEAEFDFVSAHDGSHHTARTFGEAMDSGDKATNKAMSAAYKYACFQTFCIPTEGDHDSENDSPQVKPDAKPATASAPRVQQGPATQQPAPSPGPPRAAAPVVPHPSVPQPPKPAGADAKPSAVLVVKDGVVKKQSGTNAKGVWNLWAITFSGKVKATDGTFTNRASTFDDALAATADGFAQQERPVLPVVVPTEGRRGSYTLEKFELQA